MCCKENQRVNVARLSDQESRIQVGSVSISVKIINNIIQLQRGSHVLTSELAMSKEVLKYYNKTFTEDVNHTVLSDYGYEKRLLMSLTCTYCSAVNKVSMNECLITYLYSLGRSNSVINVVVSSKSW